MAGPSPSTENTPEEEKVETVSFGLWWPAGDPGELRAAAIAWEAMANQVDTTTTTLTGATTAVTQANTATAISAFADHWQRTGGPGGALPTLAGYCRDMATALRELADEIDDAREKILQLAAEIVASVAIVQVGRNVAFNDDHNPFDGFNLGEVGTSGALGLAAGGTLGGALAARAMRPPRLKVDDSQFGSKVGKLYGLLLNASGYLLAVYANADELHVRLLT